MSSTALARHRGLNEATAGRLLRTLVAEGLVRREASTGRYHVDPFLWVRLNPILLNASSLGIGIRFVLQQLAARAGVTAMLVCADVGRYRGVPCSYATPQRAAHYDPAHDRYPPLHSTAGGKCYLAFQPESVTEEYIARGLSAETENTVTSPVKLREQLAAIRRRGYAVTREESTPGAAAVAVPVINPSGEVLATVGLVPLRADLTDHNVGRWVPLLRAAATTLSRVLTAEWLRRMASGR
jgi:DNA-binding IclR family transcriptional regulator